MQADELMHMIEEAQVDLHLGKVPPDVFFRVLRGFKKRLSAIRRLAEVERRSELSQREEFSWLKEEYKEVIDKCRSLSAQADLMILEPIPKLAWLVLCFMNASTYRGST